VALTGAALVWLWLRQRRAPGGLTAI